MAVVSPFGAIICNLQVWPIRFSTPVVKTQPVFCIVFPALSTVVVFPSQVVALSVLKDESGCCTSIENSSDLVSSRTSRGDTVNDTRMAVKPESGNTNGLLSEVP